MHFLTALTLVALSASPAVPKKQEQGQLVMDGMHTIPAQIRERILPYQNTRSALFAAWENDGVLIRTRFGEAAQVHRVAGPKMARQQLTFLPNPVAGAWTLKKLPEGFLFAMDEGGSEFHQLYWFDLKSGRHTMLTDGKSRNIDALPSKAGDRFVFMSNLRNGKDMDLYLASAPDPKQVKRLKDLNGSWNPLAWSQDDKRLLLVDFRSVNESYLWVLDVATGALTEVNPQEGKKKIAYRTAVFSRDGKSVLYASDEDSDFHRITSYELASGKKTVLTPATLKWDVEHVVMSDDGKTLAYTVNEEGRSVLFTAPSDRVASAKRVNIPLGVMFRPPAFDLTGTRLAVTLSVADATSDVFMVDVKQGKVTRWTQSELGGMNPERVTTPELVRFPSFDGRSIPAWYHRPKDAKGATPVVILIHGGPESQERAGLSPVVQMLVNELGVSVLVPNVRGSTGYGKTYSMLDNAEKREDSVKDIGALLDFIATRPELDKNRVAVYGGSYGGYMVLASLATYPERIRTGVDIVGISNFVTFLESTQAYRRDLRRAEYGDERDPKMRKHLEAISPTTNAGKIRVPLFVVQGLNDPRVPVGEAEQIVKAVRKNNVPVWYLLAKDEGHGFQRKTNTDFLYASVATFLETYLVGGGAANANQTSQGASQ